MLIFIGKRCVRPSGRRNARLSLKRSIWHHLEWHLGFGLTIPDIEMLINDQQKIIRKVEYFVVKLQKNLDDQKCHPVEHEECGVEYEEVCAEAVEARCQVLDS